MLDRQRAEVIEAAVGADGEVKLSSERAGDSQEDGKVRQRRVADSSSRATTLPAANDKILQEQARAKQSQPRSTSETSTEARIALTKELEEIELMIGLQERKLALLKSMRATVTEKQEAPEDGSLAFSTESPKHADAKRFENILKRRLDELTATAVQDLMNPTITRQIQFDTLFVPSVVLPVRQRIVDMKMMKVQSASHQELLLAAFEDGSMEFYLTPQILLLRMESTTQRRVIRSLELDLHSETPSLVVAYSQPHAVVVYALELTENGHRWMGTADGMVRNISATARFASDPGSKHTLTVTEISVITLESEPTALALARTTRQSVIAIASANGSLQFFAHNGTVLHTVATKTLVKAIATQRGRVAFSSGSDTLLLPLARGRASVIITCPGSAADVTSIVFDPEHSHILYAGTSVGEMLVYSTKEIAATSKSSGKDTENGVCSLVARVLVSGKVAPRHVSTTLRGVKGFVIAASDSTIAVHNITRPQDGVVNIGAVCTMTATLSSRTLASSDNRGDSLDAENPVLLAVSEGAFVTNIAFVTTSPRNEIRVFQSLLSSKPDKPEASWIGILFIGAIFVGVLALQFCLRRQERQTQGNPWSAESIRRGSAVGFNSPSLTSGLGVRGREQSGRFRSHTPQGRNYEHEMTMASRTARDLRGSLGSGSTEKTRGVLLTDRERFGPSYDALSDDLKRKIAEARRETLECAFDSDEDDSF